MKYEAKQYLADLAQNSEAVLKRCEKIRVNSIQLNVNSKTIVIVYKSLENISKTSVLQRPSKAGHAQFRQLRAP